MSGLRIGILGTRGIPNRYGGFEQVAGYLSRGLVELGHEVTVYNSHQHPYRKKEWNSVHIVHCYDPESWMGTAGQFIYDLNCILDARRRSFDILLVLGYTSSSIWRKWYPGNARIITNMDGWEWKRSKYSPMVRRFLLYAEKLAGEHSDHLVADSPAIFDYLSEKYRTPSTYIAYGADEITDENDAVLHAYGLNAFAYHMLMARMEPENNVECILEGLCTGTGNKKILVIGNTATPYGRKILKRFSNDARVIFIGAVFDPLAVHTLRKYAALYFHGHSVGGTNPSLLEAMASGALVCAHDNAFNRAVLGRDALYFANAEDVAAAGSIAVGEREEMIRANKEKIRTHFNWPGVIIAYHRLFTKLQETRI
jgi:glycosyltransferase involved in cell wall biosynthesis